MGQGDSGETSREQVGEGEWLSVAAAARRLRVTPRAIRSRIEHGSIKWKAAGNSGKLVLIEPGEAPGEDETELLRERLTAALVAQAKAEATAAVLRESLDRERALIDELRRAEHGRGRSWWRKLWG
jgi:hypothetical protein